MNPKPAPHIEHGNAYNIFILVLTVMSLVVMVLLFLPLDNATLDLLTFYDNFICVVFLIDFAYTMARAPSRSDYFFKQRGWLDLIGSVPSFQNPILRFSGLLRLARLSRFARITRLLRGQNKKQLVDDVLTNRSQYAAFITILLAVIVLSTASVVVLNAEQRSADANIRSGWDAFWWSFVTITTVGYGDRFPVTVVGRIGAMFVMTMGIGIIGALASILASILVPSPPESAKEDATSASPSAGGPSAGGPSAAGVEQELNAVKAELSHLKEVVERLDRRIP
jgi:voltage-gated potassium channel